MTEPFNAAVAAYLEKGGELHDMSGFWYLVRGPEDALLMQLIDEQLSGNTNIDVRSMACSADGLPQLPAQYDNIPGVDSVALADSALSFMSQRSDFFVADPENGRAYNRVAALINALVDLRGYFEG